MQLLPFVFFVYDDDIVGSSPGSDIFFYSDWVA